MVTTLVRKCPQYHLFYNVVCEKWLPVFSIYVEFELPEMLEIKTNSQVEMFGTVKNI